MKLKKLTLFALTAALCTGLFAAGCGTTSEVVQEEPVETEEDDEEEEALPEEEDEPEKDQEDVLQVVGDPSSSTEILMTNEMGKDITGLAVKETDEEEYPENMMEANQFIADGETVEFFCGTVDPEDEESSEGTADCSLQVTTDDGNTYELSGFNIDDMSEVALCLKDGVAYLKYLSISKNITFNTIEIERTRSEELKAARDVIDQIAAIGEVTSDNKDAVRAAREAYDALNDNQKASVTNLALLEEMETAAAAIEEEEAAAQAAAEQAAAEQAAAEQAAAEQAAAEKAAAEAEAQAASGFSFADIGGQTFGYSSGAGAWETELTVNSDGTFYGQFHDSNWMEVTISNFSGKFATPTKINDYTYSTYVEYISYDQTPGTEEEIDGVLYKYDTAYGISDGASFKIYLPSTPVSEIPGDIMDFRSGVFSGKSTADRYILHSDTDAAGFM